METSESSNLKSKEFCPIRGEWVNLLPEEKVRLSLIRFMTERLEYPSQLIAVERSLHQFPHLAGGATKNLPKRRADIVCYARDIHPEHALYPLLLIECKAVPLTATAVQQLTGYNHYLKAYFIALCNGSEMRSGYFDENQGGYVFSNTLPSYKELLRVLEKRRSR
jgi:hypothetical protein